MIGWTSSLILLAPLVKQVYKQWREGNSEGVSKWLFIGQLAASVGFTIYSYLLGNWVFTVTNSILTVNNAFGILRTSILHTVRGRDISHGEHQQVAVAVPYENLDRSINSFYGTLNDLSAGGGQLFKDRVEVRYPNIKIDAFRPDLSV